MANLKSPFIRYNKNKIKKLHRQFIDYHETISEKNIPDFIFQFDDKHWEIALRLLEKIKYYSNHEVTRQVRLLANILESKVNIKSNDVYFCSMSQSSGKSTDVIISRLRDALGLDHKRYKLKFIHLPTLRDWQGDSTRKKIIFVDDFVGSGGTVSALWEILSVWYNPKHTYYVAVIAGFERSINEIEMQTPLKVVTAEDPFPDATRVFHKDNSDFDEQEKEILKKYCRFVDSRLDYRYGYKNCQALVAFYDHVPNNTLPILYSKQNENWEPLFRILGN